MVSFTPKIKASNDLRKGSAAGPERQCFAEVLDQAHSRKLKI